MNNVCVSDRRWGNTAALLTSSMYYLILCGYMCGVKCAACLEPGWIRVFDECDLDIVRLIVMYSGRYFCRVRDMAAVATRPGLSLRIRNNNGDDINKHNHNELSCQTADMEELLDRAFPLDLSKRGDRRSRCCLCVCFSSHNNSFHSIPYGVELFGWRFGHINDYYHGSCCFY